jgi:hypothetical protein
MSSYYDCSPESNNTKVKVYGPETSDIINNITGIFMLLTSIGVTSLIIFAFQANTPLTGVNKFTNLLFLLTIACIFIIIGFIGTYRKMPNMSIYGFSSFILIGLYTVFLFLSGNLKDLKLPEINQPFIPGFNPIFESFVAISVLFIGLLLAYFFGYGNIKKHKNKKINRERKRKRNTASAILAFSLVGAILFVAFGTVYKNQ